MRTTTGLIPASTLVNVLEKYRQLLKAQADPQVNLEKTVRELSGNEEVRGSLPQAIGRP